MKVDITQHSSSANRRDAGGHADQRRAPQSRQPTDGTAAAAAVCGKRCVPTLEWAVIGCCCLQQTLRPYARVGCHWLLLFAANAASLR